MVQTRAQKSKSNQPVEAEEVEAKKVETPAADETEDLLADIDDVLEENAEEFIAGYVQKGGQ